MNPLPSKQIFEQAAAELAIDPAMVENGLFQPRQKAAAAGHIHLQKPGWREGWQGFAGRRAYSDVARFILGGAGGGGQGSGAGGVVHMRCSYARGVAPSLTYAALSGLSFTYQ